MTPIVQRMLGLCVVLLLVTAWGCTTVLGLDNDYHPFDGGSGGGSCSPVDDGDPCTDDLCEGGTPVNKPAAAGTMCTMGGTRCDGMGHCVACLAPADCPGTDDACQMRTCTDGQCGVSFTAFGTALPAQTVADCRQAVCDGQGGITYQNNDGDLPDDNNPCTKDTCSGGMASNPFEPQGTTCGMSQEKPLLCDGAGKCVGCIQPSDCAGVDDECKTRTCVENVCGVSYTAAGTVIAAQVVGDCAQAICDGNGNVSNIPEDDDLPADDGDDCTDDVCTAGAPSHPAKTNGLACDDGDACTQTGTCQTGICIGGNPLVCNEGANCVAGACVAPPCTGMLGLPGPPTSTVGVGPHSVATADLNGDGKPDLAVANGSSDNVSVLLNQGNGTFAAAVHYAAGLIPTSVATADLNGDGKPDLAVANLISNNVSVLLNQGNGTFAAAVHYAAGTYPESVATADLNGDGKPDLAVANSSSNNVSVLLNQ
ncbi:VCBS repeat-containing protein, partial [Polyangium sp. 6x1]|uniref:FG-GAP repeat domain-containing protein n=1 Tax=Polyangium sp. 6x1 TaxID=3042689 RepID=UPI00248326CA